MRWSLALVLVVTAGCGARSALDEGVVRDVAARDAGRVDAGRVDAGRVDAGARRCGALRALGDPVAVFGEARAEGPLISARGGGFDVGALVLDTPPFAYRVRRIELRDAGIALGVQAALGPDARGVAALAARGGRLALCYGALDLEGPTRIVHTDDLDYASSAASTIGSEGGDHCGLLVAGSDRWLVGWQDRAPDRFGWSIAEIDDLGNLLTSALALPAPPLGAASLASGGFAYAHQDPIARATAHVVFRDGGREREVVLVSDETYSIEHLALVASPSAPDALEVAFTDLSRALVVLSLTADGTLRDVVRRRSLPAIVSRPALAVLQDRVLLALAACEGPIERPGAITLDRRDGADHAPLLRLDRPQCPHRPALATLDDRALLAWQEGERVLLLALECAD